MTKANPRTPPASPEAEESLIACAMLDGTETLPMCVEAGIMAESFYDPVCRLMYEHLTRLQNDRQPTDAVMLAESLKKAGQLDSVGGIVRISKIQDSAPTSAHRAYYIAEVRSNHLRRQLIEEATRAIEKAYNCQDDPAGLMDEVQSRILGLSASSVTQNAVAAAPVFASKAVVATGTAHAIVANAGCANACTGEQGEKDAKATQEIAAKALGCDPLDVIVASTGVIGVTLPMDKMENGVKEAVSALSEDGSSAASQAIMTTDTHPKSAALEIEVGGKKVRFGVIAKGSGMIQPNMATMLCFITTDLAIDGKLLQKALSEIVETSFNMISIDGDMSTNDMVIVMANGAAGNAPITEENEDYAIVKEALDKLCKEIKERA